jgi:hypothetical protein
MPIENAWRDDVGVEVAPGLLGRHLAEPAERSDVVAPDDDRVLGRHASNARRASVDSPAMRRSLAEPFPESLTVPGTVKAR